MRRSHRPSRAGGGSRWTAPIALGVATLLATALTLVSAGSLPGAVVDGLARAVGGCDSLVEVERSGSLVVFSEVSGGAVDPVGSCGSVGSGDRDQLAARSVVIADQSGEALPLDGRDRGRVVEVGSWRGVVLGRVEVEPGPFLVRISGDGVVALGLDPREVESRRRGPPWRSFSEVWRWRPWLRCRRVGRRHPRGRCSACGTLRADRGSVDAGTG